MINYVFAALTLPPLVSCNTEILNFGLADGAVGGVLYVSSSDFLAVVLDSTSPCQPSETDSKPRLRNE